MSRNSKNVQKNTAVASPANDCYTASLDERIAMLIEQEQQEGKEQILWMSFCDTSKPKGEQFLGVIITKALGPVHALKKTHQMKINPGGEVMSYEVTEIQNFNKVSDRLLNKKQLKKYGLL